MSRGGGGATGVRGRGENDGGELRLNHPRFRPQNGPRNPAPSIWPNQSDARDRLPPVPRCAGSAEGRSIRAGACQAVRTDRRSRCLFGATTSIHRKSPCSFTCCGWWRTSQPRSGWNCVGAPFARCVRWPQAAAKPLSQPNSLRACGGGNTAPAPFELFLASIGTCAGIYVKSFCDRREIPTEGIKIIQTMEFDEIKKVPGMIMIDIQLPAGFPEKYRDAVVSAAELCLVKKTIASQPHFKVMTSLK